MRAVLTAHAFTQPGARGAIPFQAYNVGTGDYITVTEIAHIALECVGLNAEDVEFQYTSGNRAWKGDEPIVRFNSERIRATGWRCERSSREALRQSILAMLPDLRSGRM